MTRTVVLERELGVAVTARPRLTTTVDEMMTTEHGGARKHITTLRALMTTFIPGPLVRRLASHHRAPVVSQLQALTAGGLHGLCHQRRCRRRGIVRRQGMVDSLNGSRWLRTFVEPEHLSQIYDQQSLPAVGKYTDWELTLESALHC